ncbi:MAG: ABC transporter permease subunit [Oligoflexia bacterium]|nr:ABC transporter permease subunit [Oligoflexia bacterium]
MRATLRGVLLTAAFDLRCALRSRKAVLLLLLYLAGATATSGAFVSVLRSIEKGMADTLAVAHTEQPGTMTASLMKSDQLHDVVEELVGDPVLAAELVAVPPLALFYGWVAMTFVPVLVTITSSDAIAADVDCGASRFALVRSSRGAWASGKLLGQAVLMGTGVALGGLGSWMVGLFALADYPAANTAMWMARLGGRACVSGFAYLGLVMGISQITRSANKARAGGLLALVLVGVGRQFLQAPRVHDAAPVIFDSLLVLFPGSHALDLWRPEWSQRLPAELILLAIGGCAFMAGHAWFLRRDA